jgi:hypothetical protein
MYFVNSSVAFHLLSPNVPLLTMIANNRFNFKHTAGYSSFRPTIASYPLTILSIRRKDIFKNVKCFNAKTLSLL